MYRQRDSVKIKYENKIIFKQNRKPNSFCIAEKGGVPLPPTLTVCLTNFGENLELKTVLFLFQFWKKLGRHSRKTENKKMLATLSMFLYRYVQCHLVQTCCMWEAIKLTLSHIQQICSRQLENLCQNMTTSL